MFFSPIQSVTYQLYLFQLENYRIKRFLKLLKKKFWHRAQEPRNKIVWTLKLIYLFSLALILKFALALGTAYAAYQFIAPSAALAAAAGFVTLYLLSLFFFIVLIPATVIYLPLDYLLKQRIISRAKAKMTRFSHTKIIGITGSYGKTTVKEILATILSEKFRVLKTPENINTPLGVSRLILNELNSDTEIFVVEMGAYQQGDIAAICGIAQPDISIITGINESHLERFGGMENTIAAKFEIADAVKKNGLIVLNADDATVVERAKKYQQTHQTFFYTSGKNSLADYQIDKMQFFEDGSGIAFELRSPTHDFGALKIPFLGAYAAGAISCAVMIAERLGMSDEKIRRGIAQLKPIPHRLEAMRGNNGTLVIDDSYNGNPDGAAEAIAALARFSNRRKVYITPGLVEMGEQAKKIHNEIGKKLAHAADIVVLIKNSITPYIAEALEQNGFSNKNILWFDSAPEAHKSLATIVRPGDVVLFQNDWPDNYV